MPLTKAAWDVGRVGITMKRLPAAAHIAAVYLLLSSTAPVLAGGVDIPTGAPPSPLFGAQPFSQEVLLFEEFGTAPIPQAPCAGCTLLPQPVSCGSGPATQSIDAFLNQPLAALPSRLSNQTGVNPWLAKISACVSPIAFSPAEGRPDGEFFAHQRWDEFAPRIYFQSATTGARANGGLRDTRQRHNWTTGEFAPGGLNYHGKTGAVGAGNQGTEVRFHRNMPVQLTNSVWTFDGTMPPKLLMARIGMPILFRHYNMLPVDDAANNGFGKHTITTHEHNGHNPAESDGFTGAFFFPGQYYDYSWPMALAGYDSLNTTASDDRAGYPDDAGGITRVRGDWHEIMSTHWFHDHMLDYTAQNVYKGNAAMMNYYSSVDRGREGFQCNYTDAAYPNLCLPSGTGLDWGNRDYDVNLVIADKAWSANGQLWFNIFNKDGFLGDQVLVNWAWKPYLNVRARRYRFRILNGSVSRYFRLALVDQFGQRVPSYLVANDGNIMGHAVPFPNAQSQDLPTMAIAERFDIVVDFKGQAPGSRLYLVNVMEHSDGKGPKQIIPLASVLSGAYKGDPAVGKFMEFRVNAYNGTDLSMDPADYVEGAKWMIPLPALAASELAAARVREFEFGRSSGTDGNPWTIKTDGGQGLSADIHRITAAPEVGALEIWRLKNGGNGWSHPVHIHFEESRILSRDGAPPPIWEKYARKDVFNVGTLATAGASTIEVALRVREFSGTYVEHCHNTQHEDHAMLMRWDARNPGSTIMIPTPVQDWTGTHYEPSFALPPKN